MSKVLTWLCWSWSENTVDVKALILLLIINSRGAGAALGGGVRVEAIQGG